MTIRIDARSNPLRQRTFAKNCPNAYGLDQEELVPRLRQRSGPTRVIILLILVLLIIFLILIFLLLILVSFIDSRR